MESRILIALALFTAVFAAIEELHVEIDETGEHFKETVDFDKKHGLEMIKVPAHGQQIEEVEVLKDLRMGFKAAKLPRMKHCYVMPLEDDEKNMFELETGIFLSRGRVPKNGIKKHLENIVVIGDIPHVWNTPVLQNFCGDNEIVLVHAYENKENLEKIAVKLAVDAKKNSRKRALLREFVACDNKSTMTISTCTDVSKLQANCRIRTKWCTYIVGCPLNPSSGGFQCGSQHKLNSIVCCDYACNM